MEVFLVTPHTKDEDFDNKKSIVERILNKHKIKLNTAGKGVSLSANDTIKLYQKSDFFIADISLERPSCYYELGYLQALKKRGFIISKENEKIHQLLNRDSIRFYNDLIDYEKMIERIAEEIAKEVWTKKLYAYYINLLNKYNCHLF